MARPDVTTRWVARGRRLGARAEAARSRHPIIDVGYRLVERDSSIGGGLLAGALAYRLFVLLLPTALLCVGGPRALRGRRRQEHERGGQRSGPTRADRLA